MRQVTVQTLTLFRFIGRTSSLPCFVGEAAKHLDLSFAMKTSFYLRFIVLLCLFQILINPLFAKVIESDWYNYKIKLPDACSVTYEGKDNNIVKILSPGNKTTFYIIGIESSRSDKVFKNSFMDEVDALYFKQLNLN